MGTLRLLVPCWLAIVAFLGVVGLYWHSLGADYRFPTAAALALSATGLAMLAWWCVQAHRIAERDRDGWAL